jgi:hypothetical protein
MSWITKQIAWRLPSLGDTEAEAETAVDTAAEAEQDALTDSFLESYVCWREACTDVHSTYERWKSGEGREQALAFEAHRAALDREEHAADIHSKWARRLSDDHRRTVRPLSHERTA